MREGKGELAEGGCSRMRQGETRRDVSPHATRLWAVKKQMLASDFLELGTGDYCLGRGLFVSYRSVGSRCPATELFQCA